MGRKSDIDEPFTFESSEQRQNAEQTIETFMLPPGRYRGTLNPVLLRRLNALSTQIQGLDEATAARIRVAAVTAVAGLWGNVPYDHYQHAAVAAIAASLAITTT